MTDRQRPEAYRLLNNVTRCYAVTRHSLRQKLELTWATADEIGGAGASTSAHPCSIDAKHGTTKHSQVAHQQLLKELAWGAGFWSSAAMGGHKLSAAPRHDAHLQLLPSPLQLPHVHQLQVIASKPREPHVFVRCLAALHKQTSLHAALRPASSSPVRLTKGSPLCLAYSFGRYVLTPSGI